MSETQTKRVLRVSGGGSMILMFFCLMALSVMIGTPYLGKVFLVSK